MKFIKYLYIALIIMIPVSSFGQPLTQSSLSIMSKRGADDDVYTYYDLRNRKTYLQLTRSEFSSGDDNSLCIHVQIFQQDQGCDEINFEDELTFNDTVIYDLDNIVRNNGTPVPANLGDDSYGIVTVATFECDDRGTDPDGLLGNVRILDDAGYEYRMNLFSQENSQTILSGTDGTPDPAIRNIFIPFNTVDGATHADVIGFVVGDDRSPSGSDEGDTNDLNYNEEAGVSFSIFLLDEDEERLSCDQKTFGCGPNVTLNYGINEDYPNSRGGPLLCEGAGLLPGQQHGYVSLENASFLSPLDNTNDPEAETFYFVCLYGLNNGNGTGSMDGCMTNCIDDDGTPFDCSNN